MIISKKYYKVFTLLFAILLFSVTYTVSFAEEDEIPIVDSAKNPSMILLQNESRYAIVDKERMDIEITPFIENGRSYVPIRALGECFGLNVDWDQTTQTVILSTDEIDMSSYSSADLIPLVVSNENDTVETEEDTTQVTIESTTIKFPIGSTTILVNDQPLKIDVSAIHKNGRVYIPAKYVAESLGYSSYWIDNYSGIAIVHNSIELDSQKWQEILCSRYVSPVFADQMSRIRVENGIAYAPELKPIYIAHGGGQINGYNTLNCLEALDYSYDKGARLFELDFNWTIDQKLVCIHDWQSKAKYFLNYGRSYNPHLNDFLRMKIYGKYTTIDIAMLTDWLKEHPDAYIITDIKENSLKALTLIKETYPDLMNNFIPQIYSYEEFTPVNNLGYTEIILTLYQIHNDEKVNVQRLTSFAERNRLFGITFAKEIASREYVESMKNDDALILTHTVADRTEAYPYFNRGVNGVYIDLFGSQK